ncbi:hypothetical protein [Prevotella sp.]|nr:hypothetical protein [Prevotella sp.]
MQKIKLLGLCGVMFLSGATTAGAQLKSSASEGPLRRVWYV